MLDKTLTKAPFLLVNINSVFGWVILGRNDFEEAFYILENKFILFDKWKQNSKFLKGFKKWNM